MSGANLIMQDQEKKEENKKGAAAATTEAEQTPATDAAGVPASSDGAAGAAEAPRNPNLKWYIIHSYSGFERKVKESLESRVQAFGL